MDSTVLAVLVSITVMVIVTAAAVLIGGVLNMRHEERKLAITTQSGAADDAKWQDAQAEIARLKDRVAVLERRVPDEDRRVASEISRLQPSAEARG
jgi:hypothetical protein